MLKRLLFVTVLLGWALPALAVLITPEFRSFTNANATTNTRTVNRPTGCIAGDLALVTIRFGSGVTVDTPQSGFTPLTSSTLQGNIKADVYYRYITDADLAVTSWTWTYTGTADVANHRTICIAGADPATPPTISTVSQGSSTTPLANSVTTTVANSMIVFTSSQAGAGTNTPPTGMAERVDINGGEVATEIIAVPGATGTRTGTSTVNNNWIAWNVLITPAPGRRLYLDEANDAAGRPSPGFPAIWDATGGTTNRQFLDAKVGNTTAVDFGVAEAIATTSWDVSILRYWIRLGTGSISGTINAQALTFSSNNAMVPLAQITVQVFSNAGSLVGTPYSGITTGSSAGFWILTTPTNRAFPRNTVTTNNFEIRELTTTAHSNGDWLCVTLGYRAINTSTTSFTGTIRVRDFATDLGLDQTDTTDNAPWLQITGPVALYVAPSLQPPMRTLLGAGPKAAAGGVE